MRVFRGVNAWMMIAVIGLLLFGCKKPPTANFIYRVENGGVVYFTNTSSGIVDNMVWDFGDDAPTNAEIANEIAPVKRYTEPGDYTVTLSVRNADGSSTHTETINIPSGDQESIDDHPQFADGSGYFYARNIYLFDNNLPSTPSEIKASAICAMFDSANFLVNVGKVTVNNTELKNNSDNSYSYHSPDSTWYFDAGVVWTAEGGNGFPTIVKNVPKEFPIITGLVSNPVYDIEDD